MSYSIVGTNITLTRGDTLKALISITDHEGMPYTPKQGDQIRFAMKRNVTDPEPLVLKVIPIDTMTLVIDPEDTKSLDFGTYKYDIQITTADGEVDTFITPSNIKITEEVH